MAAFHEVRFPLRLALGVSGGPVRRTDIVNLSNGRESRNQRWRNARRSYDAGSGIRSVADLYEVLAFFEARRGELYGFRFRDPVDFKSCPPGETPAATDQRIGTGDGVTAGFQLWKTYADAGGSFVRRIEAEGKGGWAVGQEVDPQDLRGEQRQHHGPLLPREADPVGEHDAQKHRHHLADVR